MQILPREFCRGVASVVCQALFLNNCASSSQLPMLLHNTWRYRNTGRTWRALLASLQNIQIKTSQYIFKSISFFIQKEQKCVRQKFWNSETQLLGYRWFCCKGSHWLDTLLWRFSLVEMDDPACSTDSKWFTMLHKRWFVGYFYWKDSHWLKKIISTKMT